MAFTLKSFDRTLIYQGSPSAIQLQAHLKQIAEQDKQAEKRSKACFIIAVALGLLFVLLLVLGGETSSVPPALAGVVFIAAAVAGILSARWSRLDVPNLRYILVMRLTDMLSRDMAKGAPFNTRIDFTRPTAKKKQVSKEPWPARKGWKQALFEDPWLSLSGCFLDNTLFSLSITELTVVRSGWKQTGAGKSKHKVKTKPKGMEARLSLKFPRKKYGAITMLQSEIEGAVTLPPGVVLKKVKANDNQLLLHVKVGPYSLNPDGFYQLFAQMLLSAYQVLNLSKELSKSPK